MESPPGPRVRFEGREVLYFAGTGYLGLQGDPRVIEAGCRALRAQGLHPATTRTGFGESALVLGVEERAARFFGTEAALSIIAGYAAPAALVQSMPEAVDLILADEWLHHAGHDAAALAGARLEHFRHGDADDLRARLRAGGTGRVLVMCDGVSPVRGDIAPVNAYLAALDAHGSGRLLVDDAHGVGVLGRSGRGTVEHAADVAGEAIAVNDAFDLAAGRRAWMGATLSKAIGGAGGVLPGSGAFVAGLTERARWYNGAAATPAPVAGATSAALDICLEEGGDLRRRLARNIAHLRGGLRDLGLAVEDWPTPIICLRIGDGETMARIKDGLMEAGIAVAHSRNYPGVDGEGALRIAVFASHTPAMIEQLLAGLRRLL